MSFCNPDLYKTFADLQYQETPRFLGENINRITWRGNDRILDIGSGDGTSTTEILQKFLPCDYKKILGIDKSKQMVTFAKKHYESDRVKFQLLEFGKELPDKYFGSFDHIFSFFTMNWITDQRKAYCQIHDVLSENGDCLLLFVGHFPAFYDVYEYLAKSIRWNTWAEDMRKIRSMYHDCEDADARVTKMMKDAGFKYVDVKCVTKNFKYESEEYYKNFSMSITPLLLPEELKEDFFNEYVEVARREGFIKEDMSLNYTLYYVYARK